MANVKSPGAGGAGGAPGHDGERGGDGFLTLTPKTLIFHAKLWVAYVYDMRGELLRWKVFTHDVDAAAWARKKASKLARRAPRELGASGHLQAAPTEFPWSVRVYTNGGGTPSA